MRPFASCNASIASCFWGEPAGALPVFVLSVYRIEGRADFGSADVTLVEGVYPFIASAVARLHEREKAKSMRDGLAITGRDGSRGLVVLDSNLRLIEANAQGRRLAGAWAILSPKRPGDAASAWLLPQQLAKECRAMRRAWEASLSANPDATALRRRTKILHPRVATLGASISMGCRNTSGLSEPTFVLEFERRARRVTIRARRDGPLLQTLTEAQRAVAVVLMEGASNQEIADRLQECRRREVPAAPDLPEDRRSRAGSPGRTSAYVTASVRPTTPAEERARDPRR